MKKPFLRLCAALLSVIFFMGCSGKPASVSSSVPISATADSSTPASESIPEPDSSASEAYQEPERIFEEDPGYFIFINYLLVGSYHDNQWHTIENRDLSVADLLNQEAYYCYISGEPVGIAKSVSFCYINDFDFSFKDDPTPLFPYASKNNTDRYFITFNLPCNIPHKLRYIRFKSYNMNMDFDGHNASVVLSTDFNPLPLTEEKQLKAPYAKEDQTAVKAILDKNNIPGAPVNITECYDFDYDGDGFTERFIFANSPTDEKGCTYISQKEVDDGNSGIYYLVLCKDEHGYKLITSMGYSEHFSEAGEYIDTGVMRIESVGFYDLNHDGIFELCLHRQEWEGEEQQVFSLNKNNEWIQVLTGFGGM